MDDHTALHDSLALGLNPVDDAVTLFMIHGATVGVILSQFMSSPFISLNIFMIFCHSSIIGLCRPFYPKSAYADVTISRPTVQV